MQCNGAVRNLYALLTFYRNNGVLIVDHKMQVEKSKASKLIQLNKLSIQ